MEIERISVVLRPRSTRESADLGAAMLRRHAQPIFTAWFIASLPFLAIAIGLALWLGQPWVSLLFLWWLKPLFARIPLYVVSRAVFAEAPDWRDALRGMRTWGLQGLLAWMTIRRLDPRRCVLQPIVYLEGLDRRARTERWRVFGRGVEGPGTGLALTCMMFEWVLALSPLLFLPMFVPAELWESYWFNAGFLRTMPHWLSLPLVVAYYLGMSVAEPLCTTGGFALYLGRRTELEAWDLDLAFRRLRNRLLATATTALLLIATCFVAPTAHAADMPRDVKPDAVRLSLESAFPVPKQGADQRMSDVSGKVLADPLLGGKTQAWRWVPKHPAPPKPAKIVPEKAIVPGDVAGTGVVLKGVLLALLVAAVAWLGRFALHRWPSRRGEPATARAPAQSALQETAVAVAVPKGFGEQVHLLWRSGSRREALALLYRGTVERVATRLDEPVSPAATEADAIAGARRLDDDDAGRRAIRIVRTWQFAAYADRYPSDEEMAVLLGGWPVEHV
nr:hypothetical protein [Luteibacter rhizovicinus]